MQRFIAFPRRPFALQDLRALLRASRLAFRWAETQRPSACLPPNAVRNDSGPIWARSALHSLAAFLPLAGADAGTARTTSETSETTRPSFLIRDRSAHP